MKQPKVLLYDCETSPIKVWTFRIGQKISISHDAIVDGQKTDIICICYKWLGEKKIHSLDWGIKTQNSDKMIDAFTKIVESADVVVGHNGVSFDMKQVNTQRFLHGQKPIGWPVHEDTLKMFRKLFSLPSNKLDYITKTLFGAGKDRMGFQDWIDVVERKKPEALKKMIKYCRKDVLLLEKTYQRVRPYLQAKYPATLDKELCPNCGSDHTQKRGFRRTRTLEYHRIQCQDCGTWFTGLRRDKRVG